MRTYAKNFMFKRTSTYKQRQTRLSTEWDIRLDVSDQLTAADIVNNIQQSIKELQYVIISGVERPDKHYSPEGVKGRPIPSGSEENHVHIGIVFFIPKVRKDVLELCRGKRKQGDEYCTPRAKQHPYAGWVIHHSKPGYKLPGEPGIRYESGTLPMDPLTSEWALKIQEKLKRWGSDDTRKRFKSYTDLISKNKIKEQIEALQMSLEDNDIDNP